MNVLRFSTRGQGLRFGRVLFPTSRETGGILGGAGHASCVQGVRHPGHARSVRSQGATLRVSAVRFWLRQGCSVLLRFLCVLRVLAVKALSGIDREDAKSAKNPRHDLPLLHRFWYPSSLPLTAMGTPASFDSAGVLAQAPVRQANLRNRRRELTQGGMLTHGAQR